MSTAQRVAVITGASQGIGAALVQAFRSRNYKVVATSRSIKPAADPDIVTVQGDVADPKTANLVFKEALDRFGRVDTLVNNAGSSWPSRLAPIQRTTTLPIWLPMSRASFT